MIRPGIGGTFNSIFPGFSRKSWNIPEFRVNAGGNVFAKHTPCDPLLLPGAWLHQGSNEIRVFDLNGGKNLTLQGQDSPMYLGPKQEVDVAQSDRSE